jgi:hypothetical protein
MEQTAMDLKAQIRLFRGRRDQALAAKNSDGLREARAGIKRLKRRIRKLREAS